MKKIIIYALIISAVIAFIYGLGWVATKSWWIFVIGYLAYKVHKFFLAARKEEISNTEYLQDKIGDLWQEAQVYKNLNKKVAPDE